MVGDSQIGKTSLMVKYVEGSFDEDYIQTLGTYILSLLSFRSLSLSHRRKLYGKDHFRPANDDNILNMGSWRPARVCEHAPACMQRCGGDSLHV